MAARKCSIYIMAGGTGGHVYPALAIANELNGKDVDVKWIGTSSGIEARLVPEAGYELIPLKMKGYAGKSILARLIAMALVVRNVLALLALFIRRRPSAVIGFGGYPSFPGAVAAKLLLIPVLIHEQNSRAGVANRIVSRFADKVMQAFDGALNGRKSITTGNPVRMDVCAVRDKHTSGNTAVRILILGGSLGARYLNENVPTYLATISSKGDIQVVHQCGNDDVEKIEQHYREHGIESRVVKYIDDIASVYQDVDLIICRAGAMTVSEVMCAAIPAIFIPLPQAIYNHQYHNAMAMVSIGAAYVVEQGENAYSQITKILNEILSDKAAQLQMMRQKLLQQDNTNAGQKITELCLEYC